MCDTDGIRLNHRSKRLKLVIGRSAGKRHDDWGVGKPLIQISKLFSPVVMDGEMVVSANIAQRLGALRCDRNIFVGGNSELVRRLGTQREPCGHRLWFAAGPDVAQPNHVEPARAQGCKSRQGLIERARRRQRKFLVSLPLVV